MKKRKLFIVITTVLIISLIGLSVACLAPGEVPTLKLEIYDGPIYSESDDMCYYKVEAIVSGIPKPEVTFSDDDNINSLSSERVEVGVEVGDSYTLTVTATNSAGDATATIILEGECNKEAPNVEEAEEEPPDENTTDKEEEEVSEESTTKEEGTGSESETAEEEDTGDNITEGVVKSPAPDDDVAETTIDTPVTEPETEMYRISIPASESMSGMLGQSGSVRHGTSPILIGDSTIGTAFKGYLSFDIRSLHGADVQDAVLTFQYIGRTNDPEIFATSIIVKVFDYGDSIDASDYRVGGVNLTSIPIHETSWEVDSDILKDELQKVLDDRNNDYFQLKLGLNAITDGDDVIDSKDIYDCSRDVELFIIYSE